MSLFAAVFLPVLLGLGTWQLERAAEKRRYLDAYLARQGGLAAAPGPEVAAFQRLRLTGQYEPEHQFLVDNQVNGGRVGYWVITSFRTASGERWLVNRGWIQAPRAREQLPEPAVPLGPVTVVAVVWPDMGLPPLLRDDEWAEGWPKRVQRLNVTRMAAELDQARPLQLRAEAGQPGVLVPAPLDVAMTPAKHTGYAVQWFALATVLVAGYVAYGFRLGRDRGKTS